MIRRIPHIILCVCLLAGFPCIPAAAQGKAEDGTITIDTQTAAVGDSVIVPIRIKNNPGIMAITVSVTYDRNALSYEKYIRGYLSDYTVADHQDKSYIRLVNCEQNNRSDNGIMVSFQFKVKENASAGLHPISIDYNVGDFADWDRNKPEPVIVSGGVNVLYNGSNCTHKTYGDWEIVAPPGCTTIGKQQRHCTVCGHTQIEDIPALGHSYAENWTVDRPATKDKPGIMSRHCIRCNSTTDLLSFTLPESQDAKIRNEEKAEVPKNDFVKRLVKEQLPEETQNTDPSPSSEPDKTSSPQETDDKPKVEEPVTEVPEVDSDKTAEEIVREIKTREAVSAVDAFLELIPDLKSFLTSIALSLLLLLKFILI